MNPLVFALRAFYRQIRSGEVVVLIVAISLAVAALTAVGFLTDRIGTSIERQANELLAADLRIRSPEAIPAHVDGKCFRDGSRCGINTNISNSNLCWRLKMLWLQLKLLVHKYPLRGKVRVSETQYGDEHIVNIIPDENSVWVDSALLSRLKAKIGDVISIGNADFNIEAVLRYRPDQSIGFALISALNFSEYCSNSSYRSYW